MAKDKKSKSGCMGCLGLIVLFFISLVISMPIASHVATKKLGGGMEPPHGFKVVALADKAKVAKYDDSDVLIIGYEKINLFKEEYPDITFDLEAYSSGTVGGEDGFGYITHFSVKQEGDRKEVTVVQRDDDYRITSIYQIEGEEIHPISHLTWGPAMMGLIIPYAFLTAVFYVLIQIMKALMRRKSSKQQGSLEL